MTITLHPYFEVQDGKIEDFSALWKAAGVEVEANEPGCQFYEFTFNGNVAFCREGYDTAESVQIHLGNVKETLDKVCQVSKLIKFEIHGPASEVTNLHLLLIYYSTAHTYVLKFILSIKTMIFCAISWKSFVDPSVLFRSIILRLDLAFVDERTVLHTVRFQVHTQHATTYYLNT